MTPVNLEDITAVEYLAQLPKDGLVLGERVTKDGRDCIRVTVGSDPFIGDADVAVFLPVKATGANSYVAADPDGGRDMLKAGWTQGFGVKGSGAREPLAVPLEWASGEFDGVLVMLLYNASPALGRGGDNFPLQVKLHLDDKASAALKANAGRLAEWLQKPTRLNDLPEAVAVQVARAVEDLLAQPVARLRPALLEI